MKNRRIARLCLTALLALLLPVQALAAGSSRASTPAARMH